MFGTNFTKAHSLFVKTKAIKLLLILLLTGSFTCQGLLPRGVVRHDELVAFPLLRLGLQTGELGLDGLVDLGSLLFVVARNLPTMRGGGGGDGGRFSLTSPTKGRWRKHAYSSSVFMVHASLIVQLHT